MNPATTTWYSMICVEWWTIHTSEIIQISKVRFKTRSAWKTCSKQIVHRKHVHVAWHVHVLFNDVRNCNCSACMIPKLSPLSITSATIALLDSGVGKASMTPPPPSWVVLVITTDRGPGENVQRWVVQPGPPAVPPDPRQTHLKAHMQRTAGDPTSVINLMHRSKYHYTMQEHVYT